MGMTKSEALLFSIAQEKGFFFDRKVSIKLNTVPYSRKSMEQMIDNMLDVAYLVEINIAYLGYLNSKIPIKCIASLEQRSSDNLIFRHKEGENPTPDDLWGKTIGFMPRTTSHGFLMRFLEKNNIPRHAVTLKPISPQAMPNALLRGEVDAISVWEIFTQNTIIAMHELGIPYTRFKNNGIYESEVVLAVTKPFLIKNRNTCMNIISALKDAENYLTDNPDKASALLLNKIGIDTNTLKNIDPEKYKNALKRTTPKLKPVGQSFLENLEFLGKWISEEDTQFKGQPLPDYSDFIDNSLFP